MPADIKEAHTKSNWIKNAYTTAVTIWIKGYGSCTSLKNTWNKKKLLYYAIINIHACNNICI